MRWLVFLLGLLVTSPALADDWHRAESENYVVHADLPEADLRTLVEEMETFHRLLQQLLPTDAKRGRKLQIYLDKNEKRISWASKMHLSGVTVTNAEFTGAFSRYVPSEEPRFRDSSINFAQTSYYVSSGYFRTQPAWFRVGSSAVFSTSYVDEEGYYVVGVPDVRNPLKSEVSPGTIRKVLESEIFSRSNAAYGRFFRRSREMARPLMLDMRFSGKLESYFEALTNGATLKEAVEEIGDLVALEQAIKEYNEAENPPVRLIALPEVPPPDIAMRAMAKDEIALVAYRFARLLGERTDGVAKRLKRLTKRFPESSEVWFEYAAAEYARVRQSLFGGEPVFRGFGFSNSRIIVPGDPYSDRLAWAAVNQALELDPDHTPARVLKAEILLSRLLKAFDEDLTQEFVGIRELLEPLASQPEQYPLAAAVFYQSYLEQEIDPTPEALDRLGRAFVANRGVAEFRYAYASALARIGERDTADILLRSMLANPKFREAAQNALDQSRP